MKDELFEFQENALDELRDETAVAHYSLEKTGKSQVISFSAPTGSGKTNVMISYIEQVLFGTDGKYPAEPDSIFIWLSDSPELNSQTRFKFEGKSDYIPVGSLVDVDSSYDAEKLEKGHIYFINTQKLGKDKLLTRVSDARQYSLWETIQNTVDDNPNKIYLIIDEAHRGARNDSETRTAMSIMQKFIIGSAQDGIDPMPLVIGISATPKRFLKLAENTNANIQRVTVDPEDVRASGLLKDRIFIKYPDLAITPDMAMLQAAADDWKNKCKHWAFYASYTNTEPVEPVLIIQVADGNKSVPTTTDLGQCLRVIEERTDHKFVEGEVGHTFNDYGDLMANNMTINYVEPSRIEEEKTLKVVFFKMNLSTGWDCPRAETMMSFRQAKDSTYIAQLLGRMIRTPLAKRIPSDEELNNVELFLPHFDEDTVNEIVDALKENDGPDLPSEITTEKKTTILTANPSVVPARMQPTKPVVETTPDNTNDTFNSNKNADKTSDVDRDNWHAEPDTQHDSFKQSTNSDIKDIKDINNSNNTIDKDKQVNSAKENTAKSDTKAAQYIKEDKPAKAVKTFDRIKVIDAINDASIRTYRILRAKKRKPSKSLFLLADLLVNRGINTDARNNAVKELVELVHDSVDKLKSDDTYRKLAEKVTNFQLNTLVFDSFGNAEKEASISDMMIATNFDVDRQYEQAIGMMNTRDIGQTYLRTYGDIDDIDSAKIDMIVFVNASGMLDAYESKCKELFDDLYDASRSAVTQAPDDVKTRYNDIGSLSGSSYSQIYELPYSIDFPVYSKGKEYPDHLFSANDGTPAKIDLDSWEAGVIAEEECKDSFVCWLRFIDRKSWAISIPYMKDGKYEASYPDMLIVKKAGLHYKFDLLEPHDPTRIDNLWKAIGFARYAEDNDNPSIEHLELIRQTKGADGTPKYCRLDMMKHGTRQKVLKCQSNDQLNAIFESDGFYDE